MSRYDCEYYSGYRVLAERHPNIPAVLGSLKRKDEPMVRIIDTTNDSYARIKYLSDEDIYEVMHVKHAQPSGEVATALRKESAAIRHLERLARTTLGEWQGRRWAAHDAELQAPKKDRMWDFYNRECREYVVVASAYLLARDDQAMKWLRNIARAIRRAVGKKSRIQGPGRYLDPNSLTVHRVARAGSPDELAMALLPRNLGKGDNQ